jgi:hypothetical protein
MTSRRVAFALFLTAFSAAPSAWASSVSVSPDISVTLDGVDFSDESVAVDNLLGISVPTSLGALPAGAAVTAYHPLANGDQLFALDTTVELPGPLTVFPSDVVRYAGAGYSLEFDGAAAGIPEGAAIDAVSQTSGGQLLLSFDTTVDLGAVIAADEDLVQWSGAVFSLVFDGSLEGIAAGLDLDAAHDAGGGQLGLSFDASGSVGGVDFDDEDVLLFDPGGPTWTLVYDGSSLHAELAAADVEAMALPEPGWILQLASGLALLSAIARRRTSIRADEQARNRR